MNWEILKSDFSNKYNYILSLEATNSNLKESCKSLFDDLVYLKSHKSEVEQLIMFTVENFRQSCADISDNYDENLISKILIAQTAFFFSFYSYLVVNYSFEMTEAIKDEFVSWEFDILSSLSVSMKSDDWKMFMQNFVLSYCDTLPTVLFDIYETLGLNIPPEIIPPGYNDNNNDDDYDDEIILPVEIKPPKKPSNEKINEAEIVEKPVPRTFITYDVSLREVPLKRKSRKSESSRRKSSGSKLREEKKSSSKKSKRNSLVLQTPNHKDYVSSRHERPINLAEKKLKRKSNSSAYSPIPNRTPSTPTALRNVRSVYAISDNKLRRLSSQKNKEDKFVGNLEDAERSLTQFSNESFDIHSHSRSSMTMKPVTRFKSRLNSSFISPHKTDIKEIPHTNSLSFSNLSPKSNGIFSPKKITPQKRSSKFFSPVKASVNSPSKRKSPIKTNTKSPSKTNKTNFFSPIKHSSSKIDSPLITVTESNTNKTPLKSCLKSPQPDRIWNLRDSNNNNNNSRSVKRRSTALGLSASVLLSPKVKRRLYMTNQPPQDFCEETMFMNHEDFIELSGNKRRQTDKIGIIDSSLSSHLNDNSASSNFSSPNDRVLLSSKRRLNPTRQLFGNMSSDINTKNILSASRRSMVPIPNFNSIDPETDISNSLKL